MINSYTIVDCWKGGVTMDSCVLFVNGQPFLVLSVAGIEIARLEISLQVALALRVLGIPICD
ncbi:hypothetical protein AN402_5487 [Bacillus wiedmannii]|nr:hypothetical protein AN402_5487 [Bacillus wiedmannii]